MNRFALTARYPAFELAAEAAWDVPCAALFGASGSGKTTVLEGLAGVRPEVRGAVTLAGRDLAGLAPRARRLGWVPQDSAVLPHLTVRGNLEFALRASGEARLPEDALEALGLVPLLERRGDRLSGGERQRVALARALAARPDFLLLDEPLASLDRPLRARVVAFLRRLREERGLPSLVVTHDPLEVVALAERVFVLERGRVVEEGAPASVFASAASFASLASLGAENVFPVRVVERSAGLLAVRTASGTPLVMVAPAGFPDPERVAVRAEDVMLAAGEPGRLSAQNRLAGAVEALAPLDPEGEQVEVRIRCGEELWRAKVTGNAVAGLGLEPGAATTLLVKAHCVLHGG